MFGMLLLDLQKAFDTVAHSIIVMKLKASGLGNDNLYWFKPYLSDRTQLVDLSGTHSSCSPITCGVHQGSILGPLLFLVYVNDMSDVVKNKLLLYADDSGILMSGKIQAIYRKTFNRNFNFLSQCLIDNILSLHLGKTESILFDSPQKIKCNPSLEITCNNIAIKSTTSVKYLGATLDQTLSLKWLNRC